MTPAAVAPLRTKGGEAPTGGGVMVRTNSAADIPRPRDSGATSWSPLLVPILQTWRLQQLPKVKSCEEAGCL